MLSLAAISLAALIFALAVSCVSRLNVGFLAIVLAWLVGVYAAGMKVEEVAAGFPASLFLTLVGITLLFAQAQVNGSLDRLAQRTIRISRGHRGTIPMMFFVLSALCSSIGAGNIAATALLAPIGMAVAGRFGISPFLMAIMIANGASAGSLSPVAPGGVIANGVTARLGLPDFRWELYLNNLVAHAAVAFGGYFALGGWRLFARRRTAPVVAVGPGIVAPVAIADPAALVDRAVEPLEPRHWLTLAVIVVLIVATVGFGMNVGMVALAAAGVLTLTRAADEGAAIRAMPWGVIVMVTGVSVLVALLEKTGGLDLFADGIGRVATPASSTAVAAFFTGVISIYSSTTGVVLPALLPTVPGLIERMGGGDAVALVSSICVGGHLVDVSSLSTAGALCLAAAPPGTDTRRLFNQLMAWGISMAFVGALLCWALFG